MLGQDYVFRLALRMQKPTNTIASPIYVTWDFQFFLGYISERELQDLCSLSRQFEGVGHEEYV